MSLNLAVTNTILVIEPEDAIREMLVEVFKKNDFKVIEAVDGADGLSKVSNEDEKIDVILSGLHMPRMGGLEFIARKNENAVIKDVPVVIYDNVGDEDEKNEVLAAGASDFISEGTVAPVAIVQRVARAMKQGDYLFQIDNYALDAQSFISDFHLDKNFQCNNCGTILALKLTAGKDGTVNANVVCPGCGTKYL